MKKQFSILFVLLFSSSFLLAQVEKGKCYVAGYSNFGLDVGKYKVKSGGTTSDVYKYTDFTFKPEAGYFLIDKLAAGVFIDLYLSKEKHTVGDDYKDNKIIIGPFVRYYILNINGLMPYAEGRVGFGSEKYGYSSNINKSTYFTTKIGAGATYFIGDNVGIDLFLGYDHDVWTYKNNSSADQSNASSDTKDMYGSFEMNIGIVATFGKK